MAASRRHRSRRTTSSSGVFFLSVEAVWLAALGGRLDRRSTGSGLVLRTAASAVYLLTLALAVLGTYAIVLYLSGDIDLGILFRDWYFPALIAIAVMALTGLTVWLAPRGERR
ncbi:hypothetical protein AB0G06_39020 [Nonomuraea dietziae]|uniref:hypothetical protein n=1 Tax=Nonomuraea dietziae TaxID=65515 RepID=UPI0033C672CB